MLIFVSVLVLASTCTALPYAEVDPQNVITVPPNCPEGQEYVNGQCQEIWRAVTAQPSNVVTVPANCPVGQEYINGQCRDVWKFVTAAPSNVVTVPPNCPPGQQWINGQCRDIWFRIDSEQNKFGCCAEVCMSIIKPPQIDFQNFYVPRNTVTVPPNCRPGQQWINGQCRDIWKSFAESKNVITVPQNCPSGQQYVNGQCRPVWRRLPNVVDAFFNDPLLRKETYMESPNGNLSPKNVISVPNQCPSGYRPDALGVCRPIMQ